MARANAHHLIRPVARFRLSDSVAAQVEQLITGGTYKPGDRLPSERILADEFGVGRSSMREALRALEARGFVSIVHGVGVHVADPVELNGGAGLLLLGECTVPELFEVRRALECPAAARAARRVTPVEADELRSIVASMDDDSLSDEEYIERDANLHRAIVSATHNTLLIRIYETTRHLFIEYSARVIRFPDRRATAHADHIAISKAIVGRRPQAAQRAMSKHLESVEAEIVKAIAATDRVDESAHEGGTTAVPPHRKT